MTVSDIYMLLLGLSGAFAIIAVISAILKEGSVWASAFLTALAVGLYFLAKNELGGTISLNDGSAALSKLLSLILG